jgi:hypothetical protein
MATKDGSIKRDKATGCKRAGRGPQPARLNISGDWNDAARTAPQMPKPPGDRPK